MKRTLEEAAQVLGGTLAGEDRPYGAVSTDSRTLAAGALFVALKGPKFDGGEFVAAAAGRGAVCALVEKAVPAAVRSTTNEYTVLPVGSSFRTHG